MLTQKQEQFALNLFKGLTQREAWIQAGYSSNYPVATIDKNACTLASKGKIKGRVEELRAQMAKPSIMSLEEMLERHSEIARARLTDFQTAGADGSWIDIGPENPSAGALQEITSRTEYDKDGSSPSVITKVKLHDPVRSMQEIARLKGHYPKDGAGGTHNDKAIYFILSGEQSEKLIEGIGDRLAPLDTDEDIDATE